MKPVEAVVQRGWEAGLQLAFQRPDLPRHAAPTKFNTLLHGVLRRKLGQNLFLLVLASNFAPSPTATVRIGAAGPGGF